MKLKNLLFVFVLLCSLFVFPACGSTPTAIIAYSANEEFDFGEDFYLGNSFNVVLKFDDNSTQRLSVNNLAETANGIFENEDIIVDFTEYKKDELGRYKITIKYAKNPEIFTTYRVNVNISNINQDQSSYTILGFNGFYDGLEKSLSVTLPQDQNISISYSLDGQNYDLTTCPTFKNAGEYTVYYKITKYGYNDLLGQKNIVIKKVPIIITAQNMEITYGEEVDTTKLSHTVKGLVNNESINNSLDFPGKLVYDVNYQKGDNAGTYTITPSGLSSINYTITYNKGQLTVKKAQNEIQVSIDNVVYGNLFSPVVSKNLSLGKINYTYSLSGENNFTITQTPKDVGVYDVKCVCVESINYEECSAFVYGVKIDKTDLVITPNKASVFYKKELNTNVITLTFKGLVFGETDKNLLLPNGSVSYITNYTVGDPVGLYDLNVSGYESPNYNIIYRPGVLEIKKLQNPLVVSFSNKTYNGEPVEASVTENPSEFPVTYSYTNNSTQETLDGLPSLAGSYTINIHQEESENYSAFDGTYNNLTIYKKEIAIIWNSEKFVYNGSPYCPTATCDPSYICGDDIVELETATNEDCINASATYYTANCVSISNANYRLPSITTYKFRIYQQEVETPEIPSATYNGEYQYPNITGNDIYIVNYSNGGVNAGSYTTELQLVNTINYKWKANDSSVLKVAFIIERADNVISNLTIEDWGFGEEASVPSYDCFYDDPTKMILYKGENDSDFSQTVPTLVGEYQVKIQMYTSQNYNGAESGIATVKIYKVAAKYTTVDILTIGLNSTLGDVVLPEDNIGTWSLISSPLITLSTTGITAFTAKFTPSSALSHGYLETTATLYVDVIENYDTLTEINTDYITIFDTSVIAHIEKAELDINTSGYTANAVITYSLSQNGDYTSQIPLESNTQNIGVHTIWIKVYIDGYIPYYLHRTLTITAS
ncbi:MAG: hypothetical protein IJW82_00840 [Clostridia bacterium]|nr:hypothetical protein [Clostridia bacterium]